MLNEKGLHDQWHTKIPFFFFFLMPSHVEISLGDEYGGRLQGRHRAVQLFLDGSHDDTSQISS